MAPELFNGTRIDEKCDVYSLGCILYEMVTRKVPFEEWGEASANVGLFQVRG
jgi:serine/threonine protein kinase